MAAATRLLDLPAARDVVAVEFARHNPRLARELGVTVDELATLAATTATLEEGERLGWIAAEERRLYQGEATLADLRTLGYSEEEAHTILDEQRQDQACASSISEAP